MEDLYFNSFSDYLNKIDNLKKDSKIFFADNQKMLVSVKNDNQSFLKFYLHILVNKIRKHWDSEITPYTSTNWYFYIPKSFKEYSLKDLEIMLEELGNNYDAFDQEFLDSVGVIY